MNAPVKRVISFGYASNIPENLKKFEKFCAGGAP